jgi:hypothetical protein
MLDEIPDDSAIHFFGLATNLFAVFLLHPKPGGAASRGRTRHSAIVCAAHPGGWRVIVR